jgi:hypothetical protein
MNPQQEITIKLTVEQVNAILDALGEMPFKRSAPVIDAVRSQAIAQLQPANAPVPAE